MPHDVAGPHPAGTPFLPAAHEDHRSANEGRDQKPPAIERPARQVSPARRPPRDRYSHAYNDPCNYLG
jgi:hypothetical protein